MLSFASVAFDVQGTELGHLALTRELTRTYRLLVKRIVGMLAPHPAQAQSPFEHKRRNLPDAEASSAFLHISELRMMFCGASSASKLLSQLAHIAPTLVERLAGVRIAHEVLPQ
jgi:hypothetical protein